jgi:hypothetical protein
LPLIVIAFEIAGKAFGPYHQSDGPVTEYVPPLARLIVPPPLAFNV